ncbi:MAG: hypothetical protein JJU12_00840 [Chlamydiales bacterium]|nr:hypothetical protein [Chlamydiales bacterium]
MKKYLILPFLLFSSLFAYPRCSPQLETALQAIYRFPEGKKLIEEVEADGPVSIHWAPFPANSQARWESDTRAIVINSKMRPSYGDTVRSIFFELHNAKVDKEFERIDWLALQRRLSKNDYVEAIERLEHQNALRVGTLIEQGIRQGYFPPSSRWYIPPDFETHYRIQREAGHSGRIAALYDSLIRSHYYGYNR